MNMNKPLQNLEVLSWCEVEHDLYTYGNFTFGIELDLFNSHQLFYCKYINNEKIFYYDLSDDIYKSINEFNELVKNKINEDKI